MRALTRRSVLTVLTAVLAAVVAQRAPAALICSTSPYACLPHSASLLPPVSELAGPVFSAITLSSLLPPDFSSGPGDREALPENENHLTGSSGMSGAEASSQGEGSGPGSAALCASVHRLAPPAMLTSLPVPGRTVLPMGPPLSLLRPPRPCAGVC